MRRGFTDAVGQRAGLVVLYLIAAAIGRSSVVDGDPMALVWPAGGLAVAWLITRPSTREWIIDIPLLIVVVVALGGIVRYSAIQLDREHPPPGLPAPSTAPAPTTRPAVNVTPPPL